jgi:DNA polymerase-3 subunit epsilon
VGITIVENSQIKESHSWLVQPPYNEYDSFNVDIHGITPDMTADKPDFTEVWKEVEPYLTGKVVVAHNTGFDMYVLRDTFLTDNISFPCFPFFCSYRLSTKLIKNCYSYSLPYVCETVGIQMTSHHRATVDAEACACLFLKCLEISECDSFDELQDKYYFKCGRFSPHYFRPQLSNSTSSLSFKLSEINRDPSKIDEGSYFYGKAVCFTGACNYGTRAELLQKIANIGGIPVNSVTKKTDILVVGQQDYRRVGEVGMSSKQEKAIALKDAGIDIEIMSETEFLKAI